MKDYKQLIKELPAKSVVFAFGRFNPPTIGHELLVKAVKKLAQQRNADHVIYASRSQDAKKNPLSVEKKVKYLKLMFKSTNFAAANDQERTFIEAAKALNKKYKNIIMIAGSDRIAEFKRLLNTYNGKDFNFDTIEVVSAGERDPDADDATGMSASKMRALAVKGSYSEFKIGLPSSVRDIDGKRLMNDIRDGMGLEPIKEQIVLVKDELREKFFRGEIFNEGDIVESAGERFTIVKRGSNHLLLKEASGNLVSKWIQDVQPTEEKEDMNEALTDKTLRSTDKIKVARIIATMLGVDNAETSSNPENLINQALRKVRTKALNPEALHILDKMLSLATEQGIQYDATLKPSKLKEGAMQIGGTDKIETTTDSVVVNKNSKYNLAQGILRFNDFKKLQKMNSVKEEHEETPGQTVQIGATIAKDSTDNLRRRKVKYHLDEQDDKAAKETAKANLMAEGRQDDPEDYRAHLLKTLPRMMNFLSKNVKGWKPTEEQYLAAIETGYQVMKHTGNVQQAGKAMSDELNTLHRMSQSKSGMMEGSEIKIPTEDGITMQDIRLMAGDGTLTKKTILQAIAVIRKQRRQQGVAEGSESDAYGNTGEKHECGSCDGTGIDTHDDECPECGGKGWVRDKESLSELSTNLLARYKKKAGEQASAADKAGDYAKGNKRFSGIIKATKKQFDNDLKEEHIVHVDDGSNYGDKPHPKDVEHVNAGVKKHGGEFDGHSDKGAYFKFKSQSDAKNFADHVKKSPHKSFHADLHEEVQICETADAGLAAKAEKSGISIGTLRKVYRRGVAAWNSGHRPGTTPQQWGMARVNSYIGKGSGTYHGADKDLHEQELQEKKLPEVPKDKESGLPKKYVAGLSDSTAKARAAHFAKADKLSDSDPEAYKPAPGDATAKTKPSKHTLKYRAMFGEDMDEEILEACWDTHKQIGMKKKGNRMVPDCVPKNEENTMFKEDEDEFDFPELSDDDIESMADKLTDDDYLETYDEDELGIIDDETGEELPEDEEEEKKLKESALMEVLSRIERMKAKSRIRRTSAKRERATKIALKRYSNTATINKRARRLAVKLMKQRMLRGRDVSKLSVGEKERIERTLEQRKAIIGRIATRLAPRVRKIEKARLSHSKYTQGNQPSVF